MLTQFSILGIDLYHILAWFFAYSFLGWVWESCYVSVKEKKWINRGFVAGPVVTIYGVGAVVVYVLLRPLADHILLLYLGGVVLATVLEYVTGKLMEALFHTNWWDYSNKKFNFQGVICLGSSLAWGFFTLILFYVLHPGVSYVVDLVPVRVGVFLIWSFILLYLVDFSIAVAQAAHLSGKLRSLDAAWDEFLEYLQGSSLAEIASEFKERASLYRRESSRRKVGQYLTERKEKFRTSLERLEDVSQELQNGFWERYDDFARSYQEKKAALSRTHRRLLRAYPSLGIKEKKQENKHKKTGGKQHG